MNVVVGKYKKKGRLRQETGVKTDEINKYHRSLKKYKMKNTKSEWR